MINNMNSTKLILLLSLIFFLFSCSDDKDKSSENLITNFLIGSTKGEIDNINNNIIISLPVSDVSALVPTISVSQNAKIYPSSGQAQDFSKPVEYRVTAEDGSVRNYTVILKNSAATIESFQFTHIEPNVIANIDEESKTIEVTMPYNSDWTKLTPSIKVSRNASISPESDIEQDFTKPIEYIVTAEDGTKSVYKVKLAEGLSNEKSILSFSFDSLDPKVVGIIDEETKTITVDVPFKTKISSIAPTITISDKATLSPTTDIARDFRNPIQYSVTSADGSYVKYTVKVNILPLVLNIESISKTSINYNEELVIKGQFGKFRKEVILTHSSGTVFKFVSISDSETEFKIPFLAKLSGEYSLEVLSEGVISNRKTITMNPYTPVVNSLLPYVGVAGSRITITGEYFYEDSRYNYKVYFVGSDGIKRAVRVTDFDFISETKLVVYAPDDMPNGTYDLYIEFWHHTISYPNAITINSSIQPTIDYINKDSFVIGQDEIRIEGRNFTGRNFIVGFWNYYAGITSFREVNQYVDPSGTLIVIPVDSEILKSLKSADYYRIFVSRYNSRPSEGSPSMYPAYIKIINP